MGRARRDESTSVEIHSRKGKPYSTLAQRRRLHATRTVTSTRVARLPLEAFQPWIKRNVFARTVISNIFCAIQKKMIRAPSVYSIVLLKRKERNMYLIVEFSDILLVSNLRDINQVGMRYKL